MTTVEKIYGERGYIGAKGKFERLGKKI